MNKRLYRSRTKRTLSGVCGGLEDYFNIDVTIIRLIWVLLAVMTVIFPVIVAYVIAVFIIPEEPVGYQHDNYTEQSNANYKINDDEDNKQNN